jgi:exodeoxyribonuclease-3
MRFATWNVNSVKARLPRLLDWLAGTAPDVVCLQETKVADDGFPAGEVAELGYETAAYGQGRWNGVALLSRIGLDDVRRGFTGVPGFPEPEARAVSARCGYKLQWLAALREALVPDLKAGPLVVAGDWNVAPTDADVWDIAVFAASTHVTPPERAALAAIRDLGLTDVPARPLKGDHPFTYWDYRAGMFHQNKGMRIDLMYGSADVAARVTDAYVDREARKGKGPSDHAPIVVDLTDQHVST